MWNKKATLGLQIAELCLYVHMWDLEEWVVSANSSKESRAGSEDPWVNPCPTTSSLYDSGTSPFSPSVFICAVKGVD